MIPQLRFSEFTDEWQVTYLGEHLKSVTSGKSNTASDGDIYNIYGSTGSIGKSDNYDYEGDHILIARVGANAGSMYRVSGKYKVSDNTLIISLDSEADTSFVQHSLQEFNLNKLVFGSGQPLVTGGQLKKTKLAFPSKPEQEKIAYFLTLVDERIVASERKCELLTRYKRGVMQQIFSQKIRFKKPDRTDYPDWQERKLSSLAVIKTGKKDANIAKEDGRYRFYTCSRNYLHTDVYSFEGEAILVAGNADVGLCHYYNGKFEAYQRTYVLQNFKTEGKFLFRYLSHFFRAYALGLMQTSA